jgi:hypothetical protein
MKVTVSSSAVKGTYSINIEASNSTGMKSVVLPLTIN